MTPLQEGDQLDHYRLDSLVAVGGMASVFRATDSLTGELVAIKVPHPEAECDPVFYERFQREAFIGREMNHPAVLKVLPKMRASRVYMAAEWVEGRSLRQIIDAEGPLPTGRAVAMTILICEALEYIHSHGVAHRDLKPENILIDEHGGMTLLDFGLAAKAGARRLTFGKLSRLMGTADYISPEQLKGKRGHAQSDLYAVGIMLFEMLTGAAPFEGVNPFVAMNRRLIAEPEMASVPKELRPIVLCAIRREPALRYRTAREFADDLLQPEAAANAVAKSMGPETKKTWLVSLALLPASIFLLMLYVAQHQ